MQVHRSIVLTLALVLVPFITTQAQAPADKEATKTDKHGIASLRAVNVTVSPAVTTGAVDPYIIVNLEEKVDKTAGTLTSEMAPANFTIRYLPSGQSVPAAAILVQTMTAFGPEGTFLLPGYGDTSFQIELDGRIAAAKPLPGDTQAEVTVHSLLFADGVTKNNLKASGKIYNDANKSQFGDDIRATAKKAAASAKTSDEKNIFAGLNIAIPSGGGKTEGNGDIHFNKALYSWDIASPSLFDQLNFGLHVKKGSENKADPRHFETGLTMRKTFLLIDRKELDNLRNQINGTPSFNVSPDQNTEGMLSSLSKLQRGFFRAILFDNAFRFEGDVKGISIGNVSNLLWDSQLQVSTVSQSFAGSTGFFNVRLIPVGAEAGYNITNNDLKTAERQSLVRLKTGLQFNLHYQAANPGDFLNRIEWEVQGVDRYLFRREAAFDDATKKAIFTRKGNKYWIQSDLKFMFGGLSALGQAGFKMSFNRGSLPPIYAFNKSFTIGLVFQSKDDDTSKEIKLK